MQLARRCCELNQKLLRIESKLTERAEAGENQVARQWREFVKDEENEDDMDTSVEGERQEQQSGGSTKAGGQEEQQDKKKQRHREEEEE